MLLAASKYLPCLFTFIIMCLLVPAISHGSQTNNIPLSAKMVIYRAQKLMEENKFTEAAEALEKFQKKSRKLKPGEPDLKGYQHYLVNFTLGNCYLMTRNYSEADTHFRVAVAAKPDFNSGWMNLAKCCYEMEDYYRAGHAFLKGYETMPEKGPETLYYGAVCFMTSGDNQKALRLFQRLLREHASGIKLEWKEALVQAYLACDQPRRALPFIEELSEEADRKKRKQWQGIRLHLYMSLDMKIKALEYVKRLILEYPLESNWWKGLAHLHLKENRYRPALVALTIKGFLEPVTTQEKRIIADLNMALEVPVEAVRFYERIAEDKFEPDVAYRIAQGYLRLHRPEMALKWVEKGLLEEKNPRLMLLKGDLLYELERYREAAAAFEKVAREKSNPGRAWLMAGYAAWNMKDMHRTRRAFKYAAGCSRQKQAALKALRQLDQETASMMR